MADRLDQQALGRVRLIARKYAVRSLSSGGVERCRHVHGGEALVVTELMVVLSVSPSSLYNATGASETDGMRSPN